MSSKVKVRGDAPREFVKTFDRLCGSRSRWNIWSDFLHLSAYTISNAVDMVHRDKREKDYMMIRKGYSEQEMLGFSELFAITVTALEENPNQDFLGHIYMGLELGNKNTGQFFTPYTVAKLTAEMSVNIEEIKNKHFAIANDCCIGGGAMLIGLANALRENDINYQQKVLFVAQDIDQTCACMAYIQLSLLGCPGYIVVGDSLCNPLTGGPLYAPMEREVYITPMYLSAEWEFRRYYHRILSALGVKHTETRRESDSQSDNIETCSDEENVSEPVTAHETHACVSEPEVNASSSVGNGINVPTKETIQLTFFD